MAELLEFLLETLGEVFCVWEGSGSWRFFLAFFGSLALAGLMQWLAPGNAGVMGLSVLVILVGTVAGIVWQVRG